MRHHFTKSERLAFRVMATLMATHNLDFTDMETEAIRVGPWQELPDPLFSLSQEREVRRNVTFALVHPGYVGGKTIKVSLVGLETEAASQADPPQNAVGWVNWQLDRVMVDSQSDSGQTVWRELRFFPPYRIADDMSVLTSDA